MGESTKRVGRNALIAVVVAGLGFGIIRKHLEVLPNGGMHVSSDVMVFVQAGQNMLAGLDIYHTATGVKNSYVYPPFYAFVNIPLASINPIFVDIGWYILNLILLSIVLMFGYELLTHRRWLDLPPASKRLYAVGSILLSFRYLLRNAQDANVNMLILFLIVTGILLARRRNQPAFASFIGVAAAIKILPLIWLAYYAGKKKWREAAWVLAAFVICTAAPILAVGMAKNNAYLSGFFEYVQTQFTPQGLEVENFSLWGTMGRLLSHHPAFTGEGGQAVFVNLADIPLGALRAGMTIIQILMAGGIFLLARKDRARTDATENSGGALAMTFLGMNFVSILIEDHHMVGFVLVYLFLLIAWNEGGFRPPWFAGLITASGVLSLFISYDAVVPIIGKQAYMMLLAWSVPVLPVGIILCCLTLILHRRAASSAAPRPSHIL